MLQLVMDILQFIFWKDRTLIPVAIAQVTGVGSPENIVKTDYDFHGKRGGRLLLQCDRRVMNTDTLNIILTPS